MVKRAAILKEALDSFNEYGGLVSDKLAELRMEEEESQRTLAAQEKEDNYHFNEIFRLLADSNAARSAKKRTELSATPEASEDWAVLIGPKVMPEIRRHFGAISRLGRASFVEGLTDHVADVREGKEELPPPESSAHEDLDRHYSSEVVDKLPLIISRASRLSPVEVGPQKFIAPDVERYFREAHQCYLYGFPVACAVLCRAILEAALRMKVPGKFDDLGDHIEAAHERTLLSQGRRVWAYEVKDAGNNAIHQYERLAKGDLGSKVEECLLKTRAIVDELFAGQAGV